MYTHRYLAAAFQDGSSKEEDEETPAVPPHIYATAAAAYRGLVRGRRDQSILVSGEVSYCLV